METCSGEASAAVSLNTAEFKVLQAYCLRRRKKTSKRRSALKESQVTPMVLKHTSQPKSQGFLRSSAEKEVVLPTDEFGSVADKLTKIADNVDLVPGLVCDSSDDVIQRLVELLREAGDELDGEPMNRVMGFGAQFLQQNFSGWVQKYGGWEKAFDGQDDEDEVQ